MKKCVSVQHYLQYTSVLSLFYFFAMTSFIFPLQLYGVDSIDGDVVWQSFLPEATTFHTTNKFLLFQLRSAVHYPLPPLAILLAQSKVTTVVSALF